MADDSKSPFRLWLDNEGLDSQSSFVLPSPRLVEKPGVPAPLQLGISDFDAFDPVEETSQETHSKDNADAFQQKLHSARDVHVRGKNRTVSPAYALLRPVLVKRVTRPLAELLKEAGQKYRSSSVTKKMFFPCKSPIRGVLFTPTAPNALKPRPLHLESPKTHVFPPKELHYQPYLTITNLRKRVANLFGPRTDFHSPKGRELRALPKASHLLKRKGGVPVSPKSGVRMQ